ncbi:MAG: hypothetical protein ACKVOW_20940 [Chitinophagaceae bacterium]
MLKQLVIFYIFFLRINPLLFSQRSGNDTLKTVYTEQAIWLHLPYYFKHGERIHYSGLRNEFNFSPTGLIEYEIGIKKYRTGKIISLVALASSLGAILTINENRNASIGLLAGSFLLNGLGLTISLDGRKRLQKAVFIRNQDLLFPPPIR